MRDLLNSAIEVSVEGQQCMQLHDRRTGLRIALECPDDNSELPSEAGEAFEALGFVGDLPIAEVRRRQRSYRDELQADLRAEDLRQVLTFACERVPFYRARQGHYLPSEFAGMEDLPSLPRLTKRDIRLHLHELLTEDLDIGSGLASKGLVLARTSGSTEERIQAFSDMSLARLPPDYEAVWGLEHGSAVPKTAVLTSPTCTSTECRIGRSTMLERLQYEHTLFLNTTDDLFSADDELVRNICEELRSFAPQFILANPFYLHWVGRRAAALGLRLPQPELILSSYQYLSRIQRTALERMFSAPVFDAYSATELAGSQIAVQCRNGNWHVREDHVVLEVVENADLGLSEGIGEILVTTTNRVMPLIRYGIGDVGRLMRCDCPCELSDWQCVEFHGRTQDVMHLGGKAFTTRQVDDAVSRIANVDFYRCVQVGPAALRLDVVPSCAGKVGPAEALARLGEELGAETVEVAVVSRLNPEPSLKFRLTVPDHARPCTDH